MSVWATQIRYVFLFLFWRGESQSREDGLGRTREGRTGVHDMHDVGEHVGVGGVTRQSSGTGKLWLTLFHMLFLVEGQLLASVLTQIRGRPCHSYESAARCP